MDQPKRHVRVVRSTIGWRNLRSRSANHRGRVSASTQPQCRAMQPNSLAVDARPFRLRLNANPNFVLQSRTREDSSLAVNRDTIDAKMNEKLFYCKQYTEMACPSPSGITLWRMPAWFVLTAFHAVSVRFIACGLPSAA